MKVGTLPPWQAGLEPMHQASMPGQGEFPSRQRLAPTGVPPSVDRPASPDILAEILAQTHQMDDLVATQWDATRCMGASSVAIAAMTSMASVRSLAHTLRRELAERLSAVTMAGEDLGLGQSAQVAGARTIIVEELASHIDSFKFDLRQSALACEFEPIAERLPDDGRPRPGTLALQAGFGEEFIAFTDDEGQTVVIRAPQTGSTELRIERGPDAALQGGQRARVHESAPGALTAQSVERIELPITEQKVPWLRWIDPDSPDAHLAVEFKSRSLGPAALVLTLHQMVGREVALVDRLAAALESELSKLNATVEALEGKDVPSREALQRLADSMLFARQRTARGMNGYYAAQALHEAGLDARTCEQPIPFADVPAAVAPGQSLIICGVGHACAFGRAADGRTWLYDSEGLCGDRDAPCFVFVDLDDADEAVTAHYGRFFAEAHVRPQATKTLQCNPGAPVATDTFARGGSPAIARAAIAPMTAMVDESPSGEQLASLRQFGHSLDALYRAQRLENEKQQSSVAEPLQVLTARGALPFLPVKTTGTPVPHAQKNENLATLMGLLGDRASDPTGMAAQYDSMVQSVTANLLDGAPAAARKITVASVPRAMRRQLTFGGFGPEALSDACSRLIEIEGTTLRFVARGQETREYAMRRQGDTLVLEAAQGFRSATEEIQAFFGHDLPVPLEDLLCSLEVGAEIYRTPDGSTIQVADGQVGAVFYDDGSLATVFSNQHASEVPEAADPVFGYHSHPQLRFSTPTTEDPAEASFADLISFARAAQKHGHPTPNIVWHRCGDNQVAGRIYVPVKDKWGYETPNEPVAEITVTVEPDRQR